MSLRFVLQQCLDSLHCLSFAQVFLPWPPSPLRLFLSNLLHLSRLHSNASSLQRLTMMASHRVGCLLCASRLSELPSLQVFTTLHYPFTELTVNPQVLVRSPGQQQIWLEGPLCWRVGARGWPVIQIASITSLHVCVSLRMNTPHFLIIEPCTRVRCSTRSILNKWSRSEFNWSLSWSHSKKPQSGSVHPALSVQGTIYVGSVPYPISRISMRTGREEGKVRSVRNNRCHAVATEGNPGEESHCSFSECQSWEGLLIYQF